MQPTLKKVTAISATDFKARCLQILDTVNEQRTHVIVTKHGKPVARVIPFNEERPSLENSQRGSLLFHGDLVNFDTSDDWEVNS